jgi:hypothetical protein
MQGEKLAKVASGVIMVGRMPLNQKLDQFVYAHPLKLPVN